jgi:hypothetical protein
MKSLSEKCRAGFVQLVSTLLLLRSLILLDAYRDRVASKLCRLGYFKVLPVTLAGLVVLNRSLLQAEFFGCLLLGKAAILSPFLEFTRLHCVYIHSYFDPDGTRSHHTF